MVARTYPGLGPEDGAVAKFRRLSPHVLAIWELQAECEPFKADHMALDIALGGLETAAFHFTRRPQFYFELERPAARGSNGRLQNQAEARAAFEGLKPYAAALRSMQGGCRPFGPDYLAIAIAQDCLGTATFHFTRDASFYGAKYDSAGPLSGTPR